MIVVNEHQALQLVSDLNGKSFDDMLAVAIAQGHDEMTVKLRFQSLYEKGYITGVFQFGYPVTLYPDGLDRLMAYQRDDELAKQATEQATKLEAENRSQKRLVILSILIPAVFSALALIIDILGLLPPGFFDTLWDRVKEWIK